MYEVHRWKNEIKPVEVVKETDCYVTILVDSWGKPGKKEQRRQAKDGSFFPTWQSAHDEMRTRAEAEVRHAEESLQRMRSKLGVIKAMKAPA